MNRYKCILTFLFLLIGSLPVQAEKDFIQDTIPVNSSDLVLPETVKMDLQLEMITLTRSMGYLLEYLVKGEIKRSREEALEIRDGNFRNKYNAAEIKQVMKLFPDDFIELYRKLHSDANELAKAVDTSDFKAAIGIFSEITKDCFTCHAKYAKSTFESLTLE